MPVWGRRWARLSDVAARARIEVPTPEFNRFFRPRSRTRARRALERTSRCLFFEAAAGGPRRRAEVRSGDGVDRRPPTSTRIRQGPRARGHEAPLDGRPPPASPNQGMGSRTKLPNGADGGPSKRTGGLVLDTRGAVRRNSNPFERLDTCRKVDGWRAVRTTSSHRAPAVAVDGQLPFRLRSLVASQQRRDVSASRDVRGPSSFSHRAPKSRRPRSAPRFIARRDESEMDPARSSHSFDARREAGRGSRFDSSSTPTHETRSREQGSPDRGSRS